MPISITRNPNLTKARQECFYQSELQNFFKDKWWTGLAPDKCPGFDKKRQCLVAVPFLNLETCTREDVLDYFNNSWTLTELLFQGLKTEEAFKRPPYHGLRHPLIFYYGHTAVLYYNKMRLAGFYDNPINIYLEKILETGVDEMSWDDMSKNEMEWPTVEKVHEYRKTIYNIISTTIKTHPDLNFKKNNYLQNSPWWALWMGMEHEKIHFETSSVLVRELPIEFVEAPKFWPPMHPSKIDNAIVENVWTKNQGDKVILGKNKTTPTFGWDNEYGERIVEIRSFQYTKFQITNREYYDFVGSGAYLSDFFWSAEGLSWRKFRNTKRPTFWCSVGPEGAHEYELRTIFEIIPMPWNWPVEINFHEAKAYVSWKNEKDKKKLGINLNFRLLTEAEYIHLRKNEINVDANYNFIWSTPKSVTSEIAGNVWHWVEDQFNPLPGFGTHPYYDDFSTPCFDGKHQMILGGSFISTGNEADFFSRFHFRPHFNQHSGFRMAATLDGSLDNESSVLMKTNEYIPPFRKNIIDQIGKNKNWWWEVDQPLEMTTEEVKNIFEQTQSNILKFMKKFESMNPMGEAHDPKTNGLKKDFILSYQSAKNFPKVPGNYNELLRFIFEEMAPLSQLPGHPGYAAYVAGSGNVISNTAQLIAQTLNPFTGHYMMAPGLVALEQEVIKWFIHLMGYEENGALGYLTTGGSSANMNALIMARLNKLNGHDYSKVTAYMSSEAHHCIVKAWVMLGFKKENLRLVKTKKHKIDVDELHKNIGFDKSLGLVPFFLVATAGTTKTGSVDDINVLSEIALKENLWLHVDGAYGAFFMLTEKGKKLLQGLHKADSITLDPHKSLSIPYGTGCFLVKNGNTLHVDYVSDDSYMPPKPTIGMHDYADITPELSRDYRGLRIWLPIKTLGISPFIINLEEKLELSSWLCGELKKIEQVKVISDPELTIQTFVHINGDDATRELLAKINQKETLFLSSCMLEKKFVIRICLLTYKVHYERLQKFISEIKQLVIEC